MSDEPTFTAFVGSNRVASGSIDEVARALSEPAHADALPLIFDDATGKPVELNLRAGPAFATEEYRGRSDLAQPSAASRRGRPRLGVVAREVTLLPHHWDWLTAQPGGASAALRRLVDDARRARAETDRSREAIDAAYRVMFALAGDLPGFEDASRALFAGELKAIDAAVAAWPSDVRTYVTSFLQQGR